MTGSGRIGILGGTFDPFHLGHLALARAAQTALQLDHVRIVPSNLPPHRSAPVASPYHRFAMVALGIVGEAGLIADDVESASEGPSFTTTTLARFHAQGFQPSQIFFIVGADAFAEIATWRDYPRVLDAAHFVVIARPGQSAASMTEQLPSLASRMRLVTLNPTNPINPLHVAQPSILLMDVTMPQVSGTVIRQHARLGRSLEGQVPPLVAAHIRAHHLYETPVGRPDRARESRPSAHELHEHESI